jgi:plastocyanin
MRIRRDLLVLSVALVVAGCGGDTTGPPPCDTINVQSVSVTPSTADLAPGATVTLTATAKNACGNPLTAQSFTWETSDASILSLSATSGTSVTGTAVGTGTATVTAIDAGKSGTASATIFNVTQTVKAQDNLTFSPATVTIHAGESVQWTQLDGVHDVEFQTSGAPQDISLGSTSGIRTFATPGTYNYVCGPHQQFGMTGQVVVQP